MSSGLFSGTSGLTVGSGLNRGVSSLWSGASGLEAGGGGAPPPPGYTPALRFNDARNRQYVVLVIDQF